MQPAPVPQPMPSGEAVDLAARLKGQHGRHALTGAITALAYASRCNEGGGIDLWSEVCAILATAYIGIFGYMALEDYLHR